MSKSKVPWERLGGSYMNYKLEKKIDPFKMVSFLLFPLSYNFWLDYMLSSILLVNFQNNMASKGRDLSKFVEFGRKIIGVGKNYRLV